MPIPNEYLEEDAEPVIGWVKSMAEVEREKRVAKGLTTVREVFNPSALKRGTPIEITRPNLPPRIGLINDATFSYINYTYLDEDGDPDSGVVVIENVIYNRWEVELR